MWNTFVTGVEVGLSVSLQMAGDVGGAEHLPTDAAGHFAFVSDHVGTESVFGGESRGTGLQPRGVKGQWSTTITVIAVIFIIISWRLAVKTLTVT